MAYLEIIAGPLGGGLEGRRFELARPRLIFEIGRRPSLPIVLPGAVTSRHARIERTGGEWFLTSYVAPGTWLDGEGLPPNEPAKLTHGAVLELGRCGYVLTFNEREGAGRVEELERAIAEAPADPQPWLVYGDWLQERGDSYGAELVRGPDLEPPALERLFRRSLVRVRALGPLMRAFWDNELTIRWNAFNAVGHLGLRPRIAGAKDATEARWLLAHLGDSPAARLLTSLDLAVATGSAELDAQRSQELLAVLAAAPPLRALRTLTLGYVWGAGKPVALLPTVEAALARNSPHASLAPGALLPVGKTESLRLLCTPPQLFVANLKPGELVPVKRLRPVLINSGKDADLRIIGLLGKKAPPGGARLGWDGGAWRIYRVAAPRTSRVESTFLRLNGHTVQFDEVLMPGDEVELGPGIRFRFEVS